MTKKDYNKIAELFNRSFANEQTWRTNTDCDWAVRFFIGNLSDYFAANNQKFDKNEFLAACGF